MKKRRKHHDVCHSLLNFPQALTLMALINTAHLLSIPTQQVKRACDKCGKMLFLGLGTGLGSALIVDGVIAAMELGHLHYSHGCNYEDYLGNKGRKRLGNRKCRNRVKDAVEGFRMALLPDYIVLGGGNAAYLKWLPPQTSFGKNGNAFLGGFRLWQKQYENVIGPTHYSLGNIIQT